MVSFGMEGVGADCLGLNLVDASPLTVIAGLDPAIHGPPDQVHGCPV
jgi:hypothetical protein